MSLHRVGPMPLPLPQRWTTTACAVACAPRTQIGEQVKEGMVRQRVTLVEGSRGCSAALLEEAFSPAQAAAIK